MNRLLYLIISVSVLIISSCLWNDIPKNDDCYIFVSISPENSGNVITDFENPVVMGDTITLAAQPAGRYDFSHWYGIDSNPDTDVVEFVVEDDMEIVAFFGNAPVVYGLCYNRIIDLTDPYSPLIFEVDFPFAEVFTTYSYRYVYAFDENPDTRLYCYDFGDILNPVILDSISFSFNLRPIPLNLEWPLLITSFKYGLVATDVSDPYNLQTYGQIGPYFYEFWESALYDKHVYFKQYSSKSIYIIDLNDPTNPVYHQNHVDWQVYQQLIEVADKIIYTEDFENTVRIIDAHDPDNLEVLAQLPGSNWWYLGLYNDLFFTGIDDTLNIYDVSIPVDPVLTSRLNISPLSRSIGWEFFSHYAILHDETSLIIVDIEDAQNPCIINTITGLDYLHEFHVFEPRVLTDPI